MLHDTDINEIVKELEYHAALYEGAMYAESNRMAGFAAGMRDALDIACSILRCQQQVWFKEQWKTMKSQLLAVGTISWADSEKEPPGYYDGFCQGRQIGAHLAFSVVKMRNGGNWKEEDDV